jgi:methylated-DNA-[protein]-cysteine S-methyltransferase
MNALHDILPKDELYVQFIPTALGVLEITTTSDLLVGVYFEKSWKHREKGLAAIEAGKDIPPIMQESIAQLSAYLTKDLKKFDLPFRHYGTDFQLKVWEELYRIPWGQTISYLELSKRIGNPKAIRAVGTTNGSNRISIIVPCHRVIGSNGSLVGYGGDLWRKKWLLEHESNALSLF